jgi:hypothetical protein
MSPRGCDTMSSMDDLSPQRFQFTMRHALAAMIVFSLMLGIGWTHMRAERARWRHRAEIRELKLQHRMEINRRDLDHRAAILKAQSELDLMRSRAGWPDMSDPTRFSAGLYPFDMETDLRWNIMLHVPPGREFELCCAIDGIARDGLPSPIAKRRLKAEPLPRGPVPPSASAFPSILTVRLERFTNANGQQTVKLVLRSARIDALAIAVPEGHLLDRSVPETIDLITLHFPNHPKTGPDVPYVLARYLVDDVPPSQGLLLWIEEAKDDSQAKK